MTEDDTVTQRNVLARALDHGINWIDTAATYGDGRSETSIGRALAELDAVDEFHLATKVRLTQLFDQKQLATLLAQAQFLENH